MINYSIAKLLDVHPLELRFPFEPNKLIECPVTLTNRTDRLVGVWITLTFPDTQSDYDFQYSWDGELWDDTRSSLLDWLEPNSSKVIYVSMGKQQQPPLQEDMGMFKVVMIALESEETLRELELSYYFFNTYTKKGYEDLLKKAKEFGTEVYRTTLRTVTCDPARCQDVVTHQVSLR